MSNSQTRSENGTSTVWQIVGRLIAAAVVLGITAFFTLAPIIPAIAIANTIPGNEIIISEILIITAFTIPPK